MPPQRRRFAWALVFPLVIVLEREHPRARDAVPAPVAATPESGVVEQAKPPGPGFDSTLAFPPEAPIADSPQDRPGTVPPEGSGALPIHATPEELRALRGSLTVPVDGVQPADLRDSYTEARGTRVHEALDIAAPRGTPVRSAAAGTLLRLHESAAGGHMVYAADATGRFILIYSHLDRYADRLTTGMPLQQGQLLGYVGTTGNAQPENPHLHFAIVRGTPSVAWWRGTPVNPYPLLAP